MKQKKNRKKIHAVCVAQTCAFARDAEICCCGMFGCWCSEWYQHFYFVIYSKQINVFHLFSLVLHFAWVSIPSLIAPPKYVVRGYIHTHNICVQTNVQKSRHNTCYTQNSPPIAVLFVCIVSHPVRAYALHTLWRDTHERDTLMHICHFIYILHTCNGTDDILTAHKATAKYNVHERILHERIFFFSRLFCKLAFACSLLSEFGVCFVSQAYKWIVCVCARE